MSHQSAQVERVTETPIIGGFLFVVWIDVNCGMAVTDWEMNSPPQPLSTALTEAADARAHGFPTRIIPPGITPRPDGLFSNPNIDPDHS